LRDRVATENLHSRELSEYHFPWGAVLQAMGASGLLGLAVWQVVEGERVLTTLLPVSLLWFAYSVYALRRAAREDARLWQIVAAANQAADAELEDEVLSSRPAP
jgi:hypothetical protein